LAAKSSGHWAPGRRAAKPAGYQAPRPGAFVNKSSKCQAPPLGAGLTDTFCMYAFTNLLIRNLLQWWFSTLIQSFYLGFAEGIAVEMDVINKAVPVVSCLFRVFANQNGNSSVVTGSPEASTKLSSVPFIYR
jgi:hypothetical protein